MLREKVQLGLHEILRKEQSTHEPIDAVSVDSMRLLRAFLEWTFS